MDTEIIKKMGDVERSIGYSMCMLDMLEAIHPLSPQTKMGIITYVTDKREMRKVTDYTLFETDLKNDESE